MTRGIAVSIAVAWLSSARAADTPTWRGSVTSDRAQHIAGELFPERCGGGGSSCGITYDDRRKCPFEFVVVFPTREKGEPPIAVVTLDRQGGVVAIASIKKGACGSDKS